MFLAFSCQADAKASQVQLVYPVEIICKVEEKLADHQSSKSINEPPSCQRISHTFQEKLFFRFQNTLSVCEHYRVSCPCTYHRRPQSRRRLQQGLHPTRAEVHSVVNYQSLRLIGFSSPMTSVIPRQSVVLDFIRPI